MFEPNFFYLRHGKPRLQSAVLFSALTAALAILSSCGSSSTTATPTVTMSCTPSDVTLLGTSQCTATVLNESSTLVNWTVTGGTGAVSGSNFGSISAGGLYTAPASIPVNSTGTQINTVTITAISQVQSSLTATQGLTLVVPTAISTVTCLDANSVVATTVSSGNQLSCSAAASTGALVPVNWTVTNTNNPKVATNLGSISAQGIYSAPLVPPAGQSVTITATSQALVTDTGSTTATVVFGNNVLNGQYVLTTSGRLPTKAFWARVGSLFAGGGSISVISEDTNQGGSPNIVTTRSSFSGSYSIGPDGRGTMQFCEGSGASCPQGSPATAYFRVVVISPNQAQIIEFSSPTTTSATTIAGGEMISQDPSVTTAGNGNLSGTYSFNFSGVSSAAAEESALGEFSANGHGNISAGGANAPGEIDINPTPGSSPTTLAATTYSISANARGTMTLGGLTYSFYPVSASRSKFIEIDAPAAPATTPDSILTGDAFIQQTSSNCGWALNALSGTTIFETTGASSGVAIADLGSFTPSISGTTGAVSAGSLDENSGGTVPPAQLGTLTGTYTMDACGRGTLSVGAHTYIFYIISPSDAVLQETTSGVNAHGFLVPGPSPSVTFVDATLTGSYGFRLGGTDAAGATGNREDSLGQLTSPGTGTGVTGTLDLNDFGATQTGVAIANGLYLATPAVNIRATMSLPVATAPAATTRNLVLYMVSPTLFYALDVDPAPSGTAFGTINLQF